MSRASVAEGSEAGEEPWAESQVSFQPLFIMKEKQLFHVEYIFLTQYDKNQLNLTRLNILWDTVKNKVSDQKKCHWLK